MSKFDEIAVYLTNAEKHHLALTRQLISRAYSEEVNTIIGALQTDSDDLRNAVEKHVAANRWHPVPLMMLVMCSTVVLMTACLLIDGQLTGVAGLVTFGVALVSFLPVWRTNLARWREAGNWLMLLPGLSCPAEVRNTDEVQNQVAKFSDVLADLRLNQDVKAWTMKDYLVVWMTLDPMR